MNETGRLANLGLFTVPTHLSSKKKVLAGSKIVSYLKYRFDQNFIVQLLKAPVI